MKTRNIITLLLFIAISPYLNAQNGYVQKIDGKINHVKINNTSVKCNITVDTLRDSGTVEVFNTTESRDMHALQGLFTVIGDTLIVEDKDISSMCQTADNQKDYCINIVLNHCLEGRIDMNENTSCQLQITSKLPLLDVYCKKNAVFGLKNPENLSFECLNVILEGNSLFTSEDYLAVNQRTSIVVRPTARFICPKFSFSKAYCKIEADDNGVILDNRAWKEYKHLQRNENNLPVGIDSWQFYWKPSLDAGLVVPKQDFWGQGATVNGNFDFLLQYNFAYQDALIFGWGFGFKAVSFAADGYTDNLNVTNRDNQVLNYTGAALRFPIIYRRYLDDNIKAPSIDLGLIPYLLTGVKWHSVYTEELYEQSLHKSSTTFRDLTNKWQLDAYIGLNLGRKFSLYTQFNLLPMLDKHKTDEMRSINIGISYKIDFMSWNF